MAVVLHNVCKSFGEETVLSGIHYRFGNGITCITGPSGCGKTTLLRIIAGLTGADSGTVSGVPDHISYVFQEDRLVSRLSTLTNIRITLPRSYPVSNILDALSAVGLEDAAHKPVSTLSGGMKRRVALVRAMLSEAPLILMDEPFRGLDSDTRDLAIRFVLNHLRGRDVISVTHDPAEAEMLGGGIFQLK